MNNIFKKSFLFAFVFLSIGFISVLLLTKPVSALTNDYDIPSLSLAGAGDGHGDDVTHTIFFTTTTGDTEIVFPNEFTGTGTTNTANCSVTAPDWDTSHSVTCTSGSTVVVEGLRNPTTGGTYTLDFYGDSESDSVDVVILDYMDRLQSNISEAYPEHFINFPVSGSNTVVQFPSDFLGNGGTGTTNCSVTDGDWSSSHSITCAPGVTNLVVGGLQNPAAGIYTVTVDSTHDMDVYISEASDTVSNDLSGAYSQHIINYSFIDTDVVEGDWVAIKLPTSAGYNDERMYCGGLVNGDVSVNSGWSVTYTNDSTCVVIVTANATPSSTLQATISDSHLRNWVYITSKIIEITAPYEPVGFNFPVPIQEGSGVGTDTLSSYAVGDYSSHTISYEYPTAPEPFNSSIFTLTLPSGFNCTGLVEEDISLINDAKDWTFSIPTPDSCEIVATPVNGPSNPLEFTITSTHIRNPIMANTYNVNFDDAYNNNTFDVQVGITGEVDFGIGKDSMSSLTAGAPSQHVVTYTYVTDALQDESFIITLPTDNGFVCTGLTVDDVSVSANWTATYVNATSCEIWVTADIDSPSNPVVVTIASTHVINPVNTGSYDIALSTDGPEIYDQFIIQVPIIDSDTVDVNGFISSSLQFDLDVGDGTNDVENCASDECLPFGNAQDPATNYTVDLGNLNVGAVNESGVSVTHTDGEGTINYLYFDLSTNAASGAVVTMQSVGTRPGYLNGPGDGTEDIPSVSDGTQLEHGVAGYGYRWGVINSRTYYDDNLGLTWTLPQSGVGYGTSGVTVNTNCIYPATTSCAIPTTATSIFSSAGSIESVRGKLMIGASIDGTMVPGTYQDKLQFIATSTF